MKPEAIDAIVAAVGWEPADKTDLAADLETVAEIIRSKPPSLKRICTALNKVAKMIAANPLAQRAGASVSAALEEVTSAAEAEQDGLSFLDHVYGNMLPGLFELHFGEKARTTRNGAFVRFAVAALEATGKGKVSPETIIRSFTARRKVYEQSEPDLIRMTVYALNLARKTPRAMWGKN